MQDFETKRKNLFACLDEIADKSLKGTVLDQTEFGKDALHPRKYSKKSQNEDLSISKLRGKESLFKKPDLPIAKCLRPRTNPDFKINPHKWTKYSLEDADISDRMNTTAAFEFLKDMENKKNQDKESDSENDINASGNKVVFNKSASLKRCRTDTTDDDACDKEKAILKGSKVVMPEYVVGKKQTKEKKNRINRKDTKHTTKELILSHLQDIDEINEEDI